MKQVKGWIGAWGMWIAIAGTVLTPPVQALASEPILVTGRDEAVAVSVREAAQTGITVGSTAGDEAGAAVEGRNVDEAGATAEGTAGAEVSAAAGDATGAETNGEAAVETETVQSEPGRQSGPEISAPSAILIEASTGQVVYEKNADEARSPASITKIMTLILIFDALESGKINMTDQVTTSAYAKSMGGSQVFLEEGEVQTVETLIKCIVIASGNDASVAMAEYIAGDEKTFVDMMNERAKGLGMTSTHFEDCCGLTESSSHVTSARDIAIMSRELINRYPQIHNYSTIWMDTITHVTKQGTKEFGLSNTNKLLKMATNFQVTGLKTGSTSIAKYCLSATAEKDGVRMIASIMAAPDYKARFADAATLLNYGYANCRLYEDKEPLALPLMPVENGVEPGVELKYEGTFSYLGLHGEDFGAVERTLLLQESLQAPIEPGQAAGILEYKLNGQKLGELPIVTAESVREARLADYMKKLLGAWVMKEAQTQPDQPQVQEQS